MSGAPVCAVFGGLLLDRYLELDRFPVRGEDGVIRRSYDRVGGCAINMAVTFQNLGGTPHIVSGVGGDPAGRSILAYLREHGLSERLIAPCEADSDYCYVLLEPDGERSFLTRESHAKTFPAALVESALGGIRFAAATGYYLLDEPEAVSRALERFARGGGFLLYDPGPLLDRIEPEAQARVLRAASVLCLNRAEARRLTPPERAGQIRILKNGAAGGDVSSPEGGFSYAAVPADAVDSTGAGDSFDGGLLFGLAAGLPLREAVELGARCAAKTVALRGPHGFWEL